jgi:hypothetical protein
VEKGSEIPRRPDLVGCFKALAESALKPLKGRNHERMSARAQRVGLSKVMQSCESDPEFLAPIRVQIACRYKALFQSPRQHLESTRALGG